MVSSTSLLCLTSLSPSHPCSAVPLSKVRLRVCRYITHTCVTVFEFCTSPSSLKANAALSLVVTDAIRRPHSAAALRATHSPAKGLVLRSSSGSTWLSWLSVNTSFSMEVSPSADPAGSSVFDESEGVAGRDSGWSEAGSLYMVAFVDSVHESDVIIVRSPPPPVACTSTRNPNPELNILTHAWQDSPNRKKTKRARCHQLQQRPLLLNYVCAHAEHRRPHGLSTASKAHGSSPPSSMLHAQLDGFWCGCRGVDARVPHALQGAVPVDFSDTKRQGGSMSLWRLSGFRSVVLSGLFSLFLQSFMLGFLQSARSE